MTLRRRLPAAATAALHRGVAAAGWLVVALAVGDATAAVIPEPAAQVAMADDAAPPQRAAATTEAVPAGPARCELVMTEHRSGRALVRVPLPTPALQVSFVHSVLGTPVDDRYVWRAGAWHLVEERFEGQGYGLPHAAAEGERLERDGAATRLLLDRRVDPLLVRPLPAQRMRVQLDDGRQWRLGDLARGAVEITTAGC